jgi:hypothetical protein
VYVQDPSTQEELILLPGECPDLEVAVLISNADAWSEPLGDCDEADVVVSVVEKEATAGREDDGHEETAGASGARFLPCGRGCSGRRRIGPQGSVPVPNF